MSAQQETRRRNLNRAAVATIANLRRINTYDDARQEAACYAHDSERQVIPCLVACPEDWPRVMAAGLRPEHCDLTAVRAVMQTWSENARRGGAIIGDELATFDAMQESGILQPAPGESAPAVTWGDITPLFSAEPRVADAALHAHNIVEAAVYREKRHAAFGFLTADPEHADRELRRLILVQRKRDAAANQQSAPPQDEVPAEPTSPGTAVEPFPLDTLPAEIQAFVRTVAAAIHCPLDYVAMPLLVYASAAIGNSACLEIKRGWHEYARMRLAIVGDPGDKKSPAIAAVHRVIEERQRAEHAAWEAARETGIRRRSTPPSVRVPY